MKKLTLPVKYIVFLTIFILILFAGGSLYYLKLKSAIDVNYHSSLKSIAEENNYKIKNWRNSWLQGLENIIADSSITDFITLRQDNSDYKILRKNIETQLKQYFDESNFELIEVHDLYNNIVFSAGIKQNNYQRLFPSMLDIIDSKSQFDTSYFFINDNDEIVFVVECRIGAGELNKGSIYAEVSTDQIFGIKENNIFLNSSSDIDIYFNFHKTSRSFRNPINSLTKSQNSKLKEVDLNISNLIYQNKNGGFISFIDEAGREQYAYLLKSDETGWIILARNVNKESYSNLLETLSNYLIIGMLILIIVSVIIVGLWFKILRFRTTAVTLDSEKQDLQERFNHLTKFSNDIIFLLNNSGRIISFSKKAFKTYGYQDDEFREFNISDLRIHKDRNKTDNFFNDINTEGLVFDTTHTKKDKTLFEVEVSMKRISINGTTFIQNIVRDVSAKKLLERKLFEREQIFNLIVNNLNEIVFIFSFLPKRRFEFISKSILNLIGITQKEVIENPYKFLKRIHPEERYKLKLLIEGKLEDDCPPIRFLNNKDETIYVRIRTISKKDSNNNTIALIGLLQDVTNQVKSEMMLRKREKSFRNLFENNPLPMWLYDFKSKNFINVNEAAIKHYGYTKEEFLKLNLTDVVIEESMEPQDESRRLELITSGKTFENIHTIKDGNLISVEISSHLIQLNGTDNQSVLEVVQDVSERKKIEARIQESEQRFKTLAKISPVAIFRTNSRGELTYVNENWSEMTGIFPEIAFGMKWWDGLCIQDKEIVEQRWQKSIEVSDNFESEFQLFNPKSNVKWVLAGIVKIVTSDRKVMGYVGTLTNITKMKIFEGNFRKLYYSVEQSPVSIVITDTKGNIEFVNPAVIKTTGYSKEELLGNTPSLLKSGFQNKSFYKNLWDTISSGKLWQGELNNKRKDGTFYWEQASISPVFNEKKEIINYVAVKEDITNRKIMQEELIKAKNDALESNRLKTNFLAKINHELRAPLVGIMGCANSVYEDAINPKLKEVGEILIKESARLNNSLKSILSLSSIETDQMNVSLSPINISKLIKNTHQQLIQRIENNKIAFHLNDIIDDTFVIANNELLGEIIFNLIDNAIKFTKQGSITIYNGFTDDQYILSIKDTGIGIPESSWEIVFEPFRQAENVTEEKEGIGLGLTLAKKYTEVLGGNIWFESEINKGTSFHLSLPLANEADKPMITQEIEILQPVVTKTEDVKKKLLIVEDDEVNFRITQMYLKNKFDISAAVNSTEVLAKVANNKFDVILMDIGLKGGLNGMELTKILRKMPEYSLIPIIAVTAFTLAKDKDDIMNAGCSHYLAKPFVKEDLLGIINTSLKSESVK